jgi:hypothetical protein
MEGPNEVFVSKDNSFQGRRWERNREYWIPLNTDHSGLAKYALYDPNLLRIISSIKPLHTTSERMAQSMIVHRESIALKGMFSVTTSIERMRRLCSLVSPPFYAL